MTSESKTPSEPLILASAAGYSRLWRALLCLLDEPGTPTEQLELQARELVDRFLRTRTLPVQRCPMELFEAMPMQRAEINIMLDELYRRACSRWLQRTRTVRSIETVKESPKSMGSPGSLMLETTHLICVFREQHADPYESGCSHCSLQKANSELCSHIKNLCISSSYLLA